MGSAGFWQCRRSQKSWRGSRPRACGRSRRCIKPIRIPKLSKKKKKVFDIRDRESESCFSLSITSAWSSMKILLNDVTAKFVCDSLSEELLAEGNSSIGDVSGFDGKGGEFG